jgi:hypothetical protein
MDVHNGMVERRCRMENAVANTKESKAIAPYLPFKTFMGAIDTLGQGVPKKIDRSIWRSQSGLVQGLIMGALRFFHLIDENDAPTPMLYSMATDKRSRKANLQMLVHSSYHEIVKHDLSKMTPNMLEEFMEAYGVTGGTKRKAVTFFLQAAKEAELPLSGFLQSTIRATSTRRRKLSVRADGLGEAIEASNESGTSATSTKTVSLRSGGTISVHVQADVFTMTAEDRAFVFELIDKLQGYEAEHKE